MTYTPSATPQVLGAAAGLGAGSILPVTGSSLINTIALATAAALVVWAMLYFVMRKPVR